MTDGRILIGKITGTHGVRGQLQVLPFSGEAESITSLRSLYIHTKQGAFAPCEIRRAVPHKKRVLVTLKGFDSINEVLPFVGDELYIDRSQMPPLPEGEFYWCDLLGLTVVTDGGDVLGTLSDILETGSNDVYVVQNEEREILLPATDDVVIAVDLGVGRMTVTLPDGLLDL